MWNCEYCGSDKGMYYKDGQFEGMLCLDPNCGRINEIKEDQVIYESDL